MIVDLVNIGSNSLHFSVLTMYSPISLKEWPLAEHEQLEGKHRLFVTRFEKQDQRDLRGISHGLLYASFKHHK